MENAPLQPVRLHPCHDTKLTCAPASKVLDSAQAMYEHGGDNLNHQLHEVNAVTPFVRLDQEQMCLEIYLEKLFKGKEYRGRFELI
jgi:hypothetical protein